MNALEKFDSLRARPLCSFSRERLESLDSVERVLSIDLPSELRSILEVYESSIAFDLSVRFVPRQATGLEDVDGSLDLTLVYGLVTDCSSLLQLNRRYAGQVPDSCIVIGASSGGDQICLERNSSNIMFWYHEAQTEEESIFLVSNTFAEFVELLRGRDDTVTSLPKGIVEGDSFLDF